MEKYFFLGLVSQGESVKNSHSQSVRDLSGKFTFLRRAILFALKVVFNNISQIFCFYLSQENIQYQLLWSYAVSDGGDLLSSPWYSMTVRTTRRTSYLK